MFTYSHGIIGYLLYRKESVKIWKYAVLGAVLPDLLMIVKWGLVYVFLFFTDGTWDSIHEQVHNEVFVETITSIVHSVFFWGILALSYLFIKRKPLLAFVVGGFSHVLTDFLTHQGRWVWNHFYPLNIAPIDGPFSYRDLYFIVIIHSIWFIIFMLKIFRYFFGSKTKKF